MARRIEVEIVGDSRELEKAFARSAKAAQKFNQQVNMGGYAGFAQLEKQTDAVKKQASAFEDLGIKSKRAMSVGPFRVSGAGLGAGVAVFAAAQAVRELGAALETTGAAAFTTEGRIKNMVAALTSGSIVGAVQAFTAQPKTFEELGMTVQEAAKHIDALRKVADGTTGAMTAQAVANRGNRNAWKELNDVIEETNGATQEAAQEAVKVVDAYNLAQNATWGLSFAQREYNHTLIDGKIRLVEFKGAVDDLDRPRGPGGIAAAQAPKPGRPGGAPTTALPPVPAAIDALAQLALASNDAWAAQVAARACEAPTPSAVCSSLPPRRWVALEPDNAAAWLEHSTRDNASVDEALVRATRAARFDTHRGRLAAWVLQAMPERAPPMQRHAAWQRTEELERAADAKMLAGVARHCNDTSRRDRAQACDALARWLQPEAARVEAPVAAARAYDCATIERQWREARDAAQRGVRVATQSNTSQRP